jgi:triacylglycerol lipase
MKKGIYYICSLFLELIALIIFKLTFRIDLTKKNPKKGESTHTPILLVHGYGHNSSAWIYLCYRLKKAGFHSLYSINLGSVQNSIEQYAEEVKRKALEIAESTGNKKLILLGHSMGGLVSAAYATHHSNVTHLVTLGSPLKGTKIAKWGRGQSARDMEPFSPFIVDLNRKIEAASYRHPN